MELAISIISLVTALIALLTSVLPSTLNMRRNVIDFRNKYDEFRSSVASALTMYSTIRLIWRKQKIIGCPKSTILHQTS